MCESFCLCVCEWVREEGLAILVSTYDILGVIAEEKNIKDKKKEFFERLKQELQNRIAIDEIEDPDFVLFFQILKNFTKTYTA